MNRRHDDPQGMWDWLVLMIRDLLAALGLALMFGVVGLVAGYLYGKHETKVLVGLNKPDCGSCRKGENK